MRKTHLQMRLRLLPVLIAACFCGAAGANPLGAQVVNGQVGISQQGNTLTITNSPGSIINWQSFSIGSGEITRFIQQSGNSSVLNRVVGQDPSQILGALQSNGRVFLINPNGILFGAGARIDVNGLVASTLNISNEDFLAGKLNFKIGERAGDLKNQGAITTPAGGQVYLIAPNVENSGVITSPQGEVLLAAGRSVQLVDSADPDLHVVVSAPDDRALNIGSVIAQGGKAGIYGALINQRGVVSADSAVVGEGGKIVFKASRDTLLEAGSRTSATGAGRGGEIHVLGERVALTGDAQVDASGKAGGGTVLIGGDYQGKGSVSNSQITYTGDQASIRADALADGDGGKVIVWADDTTRSYAAISVRGGAEGGNGGFVETSGKRYLDVGSAYPDVRAPKGKAGSWVLDPDNIVITSSASSNITPASPFQPATPGSSILSAATLVSYLESSGDAIVDTSSAGSGAGNITVDASVMPNMSFPGSLTLKAHNDITLNAAIGTSSSNSLFVKLQADQDNNGTGSVILNSGSSISSVNADIELSGNAIVLNNSTSINAGLGEVKLTSDTLTLNGTVAADLVSIRPVTEGRAVTVGSSTCYVSPCLSVTNLYNVNAPKIGIGHDSIPYAGPVYVAGITNSGTSAASDRNAATTRIGLLGGAGVTQGGAIDVDELGVSAGGSITLTHSGNRVGGFAAQTTAGNIDFSSSTGFAVKDLTGVSYGIYGATTAGGHISLTAAGTGDISVDSYIDAGGGDVGLKAGGALLDGGGYVVARNLKAEARRGISLFTETGSLTAVNTDTSGSSAIQVFNFGALTLNEVRQAGNGGDIMIASYGSSFESSGDALRGMEVPASSSTGGLRLASALDAGSGNVMLLTDGAIVGTGGSVSGNHLLAVSGNGMSLSTKVKALSAFNYDDTGTSDISITNTGPLTLYAAQQIGSKGGNVNITNYGAFTVSALYDPEDSTSSAESSGDAFSNVLTNTGSITLTAHSPLTIDGVVTSTSGVIALEAGASSSGNDNLVINGKVATGGGISLKAGNAITINGKVDGGSVVQQANGNAGSVVGGQAQKIVSNAVTNTILTTTSADSLLALNTFSSGIRRTGVNSNGSSKDSDKKDDKAADAGHSDSGTKNNEHVKKNYCN